MNQKVKELEKNILLHKEFYYSGNPIISDDEYDALEEELRNLDPTNYTLEIVGSSSNTNKMKHDKKMLSLEKKYEKDELISWISNNHVVATKKIDGVSCSLIYENGKLLLAKTRGNGSFGEDITDKCYWIPSIPKTLKRNGKFEIRGEIFCSFKKFEKLGERMVLLGEDMPTSPRNIVAGLIGRKEKIFLCNFLDFQAFDIVQKYDLFQNEFEIFDFLQENKFNIPDVELITNDEKLDSFLDKIYKFISNGDFQIDGAVFTFNNFSLHHELGETGHHPKYKMAFKFKSEAKDAILEDIEWNISRNGIYTPVGIIQPTDLSGAIVTRVTLHNLGNVINNNLKAGDLIKVIRSGEVIPKFESVVKQVKGEISYPTKCSYCQNKLVVKDIRLLCNNKKCSGRKKHEILNFISKIGIDDLSEKRLIPLMEMGIINNIDDLYKITINDLLKLPKTKEKLAEKLFLSIQSTKIVSLPIFLSALGLSGGALNKCEKIVSAGFDSIDKILNLTVSDLESIEGFANKSSTDIINSINDKFELITSLLNLGIEIEKIQSVRKNTLSGLSFCITGKLSKPRTEIQELIKVNGGKVVSSVNKMTNILICNEIESGSSKMKNAVKFNVKVINEAQFLEMI